MGHPEAASLDMIRRLVAFPTVSRDSNLALIDFVGDYLSGHGVECHLTQDDTRSKANLYATLGPAIAFEQITSFPGLRTADTDPATELVKALSGANDTGKVSFGTEGGLFQAAGVPTVVCGPGSIEQAHKPDEYVSVDQLVRCEAFLRRLIERVSAP